MHSDHNTGQLRCLVRMDFFFWIDVCHIEGCKDARATVYMVRSELGVVTVELNRVLEFLVILSLDLLCQVPGLSASPSMKDLLQMRLSPHFSNGGCSSGVGLPRHRSYIAVCR
ncbi:hypothetical protein LAZ67_2000498 [Cordylochernes scorpioides]|uniref:Uncharacterized protein n=1 Tax=Cordylochernes scorpioides TaxID=51811 RepID=A0ABY6K1V0_9ARAC|nr:hypothetical protein LAZ67_2000498 [Cordylochernes scorpioides]